MGLMMMSPPKRAGRVKSSLSRSLIAVLPVIAGRKRFQMASSKGFKAFAVFGIVRVR